MKDIKLSTISKAAGAAAGVITIASVSAWISTKYLLRMALDREEPVLLKAAEKRISGTEQDNGFIRVMQESAKHLEEKPNETISIMSYDGEQLVGHWIPVNRAKRVIIAVHGWRGSWTQTFGMVADSFEQNDCSVLYIEQRATNQSGGKYIGFGLVERHDCQSWINWVVEWCGNEIPIYLCGVSMGATTVLMAAGFELPDNVRGIIADCGFTSPHAIWKHVANNNLHIAFNMRGVIADEIFRQKLQISPDEYSTLQALADSRIPVLFVHGTEDHFVPVEMTYENYQACNAPKRLFVVPGADHGMSYYLEPQKYEQEMKLFWKEYDS